MLKLINIRKTLKVPHTPLISNKNITAETLSHNHLDSRSIITSKDFFSVDIISYETSFKHRINDFFQIFFKS